MLPSRIPLTHCGYSPRCSLQARLREANERRQQEERERLERERAEREAADRATREARAKAEEDERRRREGCAVACPAGRLAGFATAGGFA
jgi:membrane protein involved in colicin uptake